jgi:hypothetical protein
VSKPATRAIIGPLAVVAFALAMALPALGGGRPLTAELSGDNEVPPSGSAATGTAVFTLNQGLGEICADIQSSGYAEGEVIVGGHIHPGAEGVIGPVVVDFGVTTPNHSTCVAVDPELIKDIRQNPSDYYFNLHSNLVPSGVIRGQLSK